MCQGRVRTLHDAYMGLTGTQQESIYLIATSKENQQNEYKTEFCQKAAGGVSAAECTSDKMSTDWFDGNTGPRYIIWFFRDPSSNCQWKQHGRYSTNDFSRSLSSKIRQTMLTLLGASAACTGGAVPSTTIPATLATSSTTTTTKIVPTSPLIDDDRCPIVIDTRSQLEWDAGHAPCAHRLEIHKDPTLVAEVWSLANSDLSYPVQLYCRSGNRAGQAQKILQDKKWTHVINAGGWESGQVDAIKKLCDCTSTTTTSPDTARTECSSCAPLKKSGKLSCCARGGAWFKNCGNTGDSAFDHTWVEGIHACKKSARDDCYDGEHFRYQQQRMSRVRHPQEIRQKQLLRSWRCLVQELRKRRGFEVCTHVERGHRGVQRNTIDGPDEDNSLDHLPDVRHKRENRHT